MRYQSGNVIRVSGDTDEKFLYCLIYEILVFEDKKIFIVKPLKVLEFSKKLCAYEVLLMDSAPSKAIFYDSFYTHGVLHIKHKSNKMYIIEKNNANRDIWSFLL